jgi:hypothetical protein
MNCLHLVIGCDLKRVPREGKAANPFRSLAALQKLAHKASFGGRYLHSTFWGSLRFLESLLTDGWELKRVGHAPKT